MVYEFVVNFALSLVDMIKAGAYDWVNEYNITEANFPKTGTGEVQVSAELIHFNKCVSSCGVLTEMERLGFRAATIHELLAFGAKYPDVQMQFPVVALGSSCKVNGYRYVADLFGGGSRRSLNLCQWADFWSDDFRFLAVRKPAC